MARTGKSILPRRTFLRGALVGGISVAVPLPRLCGMLNDNGTAYADGSPLPLRFGTWFFGNGIIPDRWIPPNTGSGDGWALSEERAPLQAIKPWLSVPTGFSIKIPNNAPHSSMPTAALTGAQITNSVQLPSIDQVIAPLIAGDTVYPTGLHVGISNVSGGDFARYCNFVGWPQRAQCAQLQARLIYQKATPIREYGWVPKTPDPEPLPRAQVLDAVAEDAKFLRMRLGTDDQRRLDHH